MIRQDIENQLQQLRNQWPSASGSKRAILKIQANLLKIALSKCKEPLVSYQEAVAIFNGGETAS